MDQVSLIVVLLSTILWIVLAHKMARKKGLKPVFWGMMAALFGPLVFLVLPFLKSRQSEPDSQ